MLVGLPLFALLVFLEIAGLIGLAIGLPMRAAVGVVGAVSAAGLIAAAVAQAHQRRADGWQDYAGPSPFLVTAAVLSLARALSLPLSWVFAQFPAVAADGAGKLVVEVLISLLLYAGVVYLLVVREGALSWRDMIRPRRLAPDPSDLTRQPGFVQPGAARAGGSLPGDIGLGLSLVIPAIVAAGILAATLATLLGLDSESLSPTAPLSLKSDDLLVALLAVAVLVPMGEELFFRGFATNVWARSLGRGRAVLQAGLFFASVHILNVGPGSGDIVVRTAILMVAARIPVSLALSWLYVRRRSMYASMTLHGGYNAAIILVTWALAQ